MTKASKPAQKMFTKLSAHCAADLSNVVSCLVTHEDPEPKLWRKKDWPKKVIFRLTYYGGGYVQTVWTVDTQDMYKEYTTAAEAQLDAAVKAIKKAKSCKT